MSSPEYARLEENGWTAPEGEDPSQFTVGWSQIASLFAYGQDAGDAAEWYAIGVPFDQTAGSRPGAFEGPRAIRAASTVFAADLHARGPDDSLLDTRTGEVFRYAAARLYDRGDTLVFPTSPLRTFEVVARTACDSSRDGRKLVLLGGDHSMTFAGVAGWSKARLLDEPTRRLGFVNIDHHFDFGDESRLHGRIYHGSNSRRISELPAMSPDRMAFVGVGDITRLSQFKALQEAGYSICTGSDIRAVGASAALEPVLDRLATRCDDIYVSIDIDVLDAAHAPGTGHVTMGGISTAELFDVIDAFRRLPVGGWDVMEVAPRYDAGGRTAHIAAGLLHRVLHRRPDTDLN